MGIYRWLVVALYYAFILMNYLNIICRHVMRKIKHRMCAEVQFWFFCIYDAISSVDRTMMGISEAMHFMNTNIVSALVRCGQTSLRLPIIIDTTNRRCVAPSSSLALMLMMSHSHSGSINEFSPSWLIINISTSIIRTHLNSVHCATWRF